MTRLASKVHPWEDRFRRPTPHLLLSGYAKGTAPIVRAARERCLAIEDVREVVAWHGVAWKWTLDYRSPADPHRGLIFIIPRPVRPLVAVPFHTHLAADVLERRLSRPARESILNAPVVGDTCWPHWELLTKGAVDDALTLVQFALASHRQPV